MSEVFREIKESLTMRQVAEHLGFPVNRSGFILSPFGKEKTASCKLYHNSYYDFSVAAGDDLIKFTAAILNINIIGKPASILYKPFPCLYLYQVERTAGKR